VSESLERLNDLHRHSDFRHTSNNISSGISIKLFRAARLPRVFLEDELDTISSSRLRFGGLLSASCASGIDMMIFGG